MHDPNLHFHLFACCIPVKGAKRSIICDLQRQTFEFIPNDLYDILTQHKQASLEKLQEIFGEDNHLVLQEYFEFLVEKEYGFWGSEREIDLFPPIDLSWHSPFEINQVIIDIHTSLPYDLAQVIPQIEALGCVDVQVRCYATHPLSFFHTLLDLFEKRRIKSVHLIVCHQEQISAQDWEALCRQYLRISYIIVHSANVERTIDIDLDPYTKIQYITENIEGEHFCGVIHPAYFMVNVSLFSEAMHFNTCLHRKISIDSQGMIKNCPSMTQDYGNVQNTTLQTALQHPDFKRLWGIHKDQIEVCKDCEFRYICTDCRAHQDNLFAKPVKCNYDPYTNTWDE